MESAKSANVGPTPHPAAARPPSPARGEGEPAPTLGEILKARSRAMRREPTDAEQKLWLLLRGRRFNDFKFRRQVRIGRYIADFVCLERRLIIEADGGQHADNAYDEERDAWLVAQGFRVRRFWNTDILQRPDEVAETIWADLNAPLHQRPLRQLDPLDDTP
ncbi:MAG: endonuclease domain-containing protein [Beijerinckiaceae bacterium]|nr:endonuclease domain-containing protein [Beijerinckiaceae bacterium]